MARMYSVKSASRRWPVHVFYNIIDKILINVWIVHKIVAKTWLSRKDFIQSVVIQLIGDTSEETQDDHEAAQVPETPAKK